MSAAYLNEESEPREQVPCKRCGRVLESVEMRANKEVLCAGCATLFGVADVPRDLWAESGE